MKRKIKFIYYYLHSLYHHPKPTIQLTIHSILSLFKSDNYNEYLNLTYYILSGAYALHSLSKEDGFKKMVLEMNREIIKRNIEKSRW